MTSPLLTTAAPAGADYTKGLAEMAAQVRDTWKCPSCGEWLEMPTRRQQEYREAHKRECRDEKPRRPAVATVKRASLWDGVLDTFQTEGELNGFRPSQGGFSL